MNFPVWMTYKQKRIAETEIVMYGDFIGGFGDVPGHWEEKHWKLMINCKTAKRIWIFEQEDYNLTGTEIKQMVLRLYSKINSESIVASLLQEAYEKSVLQLLPFDYLTSL